ncbi:FabD/lysophospholipase-like protein [Trichodelitschia bisporula]|uniref:Lysophospholipase n=1 Tax=Trichodelitschia bisporula TaxID=703511 RepID=A0A6G1HPX4_9PEZI|nr:FabD/lysophospholipase-like protein [Trichodelitschia bisporula]
MFSHGGIFPQSLVYVVALLALVLSTAAQNTSSSVSSRYVPFTSRCPRGSLVRSARGLSSGEQQYIDRRKRVTSQALSDWLDNINERSNQTTKFSKRNLPTLALATSGGGYRSMLLGAGFVQALDERDSDDWTNGLYQALTYHSGLSGGAWLLSSLAGNDQETISTLQEELWENALVKNSLYPTNTETAPEYNAVKADILARGRTSFPATTADVWGRFLSYQLLKGRDGGVTKTLSDIRRSRGFRNHKAPYPIITALGIPDITSANCEPADDATQYEFHPYEFGSWDGGIAAFTPTEYLGTQVNNGKPVKKDFCTRNYDNLGYILGTSSSKFNEGCGEALISVIASTLDPLVKLTHNYTRRDLFAPYANPFRGYPGSPKVSSQSELYLADGGQGKLLSTNQNNPIWPFLHRNVDVLLVNDNSADTDDNWPNGTEIIHTYDQAKAAGLTRMPFIPDQKTWTEKGLAKRATFFGCGRPDKMTIVFMPNVGYSTESNLASSKFEYAKNETAAMIKNGAQIALQGGDPEWPSCLSCAILSKATTSLPLVCKGCFEKHCYNE